MTKLLVATRLTQPAQTPHSLTAPSQQTQHMQQLPTTQRLLMPLPADVRVLQAAAAAIQTGHYWPRGTGQDLRRGARSPVTAMTMHLQPTSQAALTGLVINQRLQGRLLQ